MLRARPAYVAIDAAKNAVATIAADVVAADDFATRLPSPLR